MRRRGGSWQKAEPGDLLVLCVQFEPSKSAPSREGAPAEYYSSVTNSAEADLAEDALAGEELGGEADGEAQHGQAAIPGFGEIHKTEACR